MPPISLAQCRMARGALAWSIGDLAKAAAIGASTIARFEHGKVEPTEATMVAIRAALEAAGVEFLANSTVRFRDASRERPDYRLVRLPRGAYGIELIRPDGTREIVQRLRTRRDALAWIGHPPTGASNPK
jgi:transcriptional regulator with XRE-family HTH domain